MSPGFIVSDRDRAIPGEGKGQSVEGFIGRDKEVHFLKCPIIVKATEGKPNPDFLLSQ